MNTRHTISIILRAVAVGFFLYSLYGLLSTMLAPAAPMGGMFTGLAEAVIEYTRKNSLFNIGIALILYILSPFFAWLIVRGTQK